jgi:hypothetical protein
LRLAAGLWVGVWSAESEVVAVRIRFGSASHLVPQQDPREVNADDQGDPEKDHDVNVCHGNSYSL